VKLERLLKFLTHAVAFDVETHRIQPGLLAPPMVCASVAWWDAEQGRVVGRLLAGRARYRDPLRECDSHWDALSVFIDLLEGDKVIVGANIAYDMAVMAHHASLRGIDLMPLIIRAYEEGRVYDVQIAEALHAVAIGMLGKDPRTGAPLQDPITKKRGRYSLAIVLWLVLGRADAKVNDRFRESYALLEDTPIEDWDPQASTYPVDDACNTLVSGLAQVGLIDRPVEHVWTAEDACQHCRVPLSRGADAPCPPRRAQSLNLHDISRQCYAALAMHLGATWGFMVDPVAVDALEARVRKTREEELARFLKLGFLRMKKVKGVVKPTKNTALVKRTSAVAYGCTGACARCAGTGKVQSAKSGKPVGDRMCDSTGLNLDSAPVPRTKGSKCRTCSGKRQYAEKKTGKVTPCAQCVGQPDVVPGCGTSRDALSESGDEDLIDFAIFSEEAKILETYIPFLRKGISEVPDDDEDFEDEGDDE